MKFRSFKHGLADQKEVSCRSGQNNIKRFLPQFTIVVLFELWVMMGVSVN